MSRGRPAHRGGELKQTAQRPLMRGISTAEGRTRRSRQQLALLWFTPLEVDLPLRFPAPAMKRAIVYRDKEEFRVLVHSGFNTWIGNDAAQDSSPFLERRLWRPNTRTFMGG